jgi:sigma-B regulation protein RsbU (phosphoserine phosphatase)
VRELYKHLSSAQSLLVGSGMRLSDALLLVLVVIGVMFLIIEAAALIMGLALARSITSSVHELFMGTERVRQGDFTHRINIESKDQLGELAESFNQMTGSIENLLLTAAEKKRHGGRAAHRAADPDVAAAARAARLPRHQHDGAVRARRAKWAATTTISSRSGDRQLGVLIADVSGKGTSAALYMAELKGLMLSLSQIYTSPRQLLMEVNRIISENLDTRSFITMTYGVLDLAKGVMTFAPAGHTPLVYFRGDGGAGPVRILAPSGIVVGLRIPARPRSSPSCSRRSGSSCTRGTCSRSIPTASPRRWTPGAISSATPARRLIAEHGHLEPPTCASGSCARSSRSSAAPISTTT